MYSGQICCMASHLSDCPTHAHFSICIINITDYTLHLVFQTQHQAVVMAALQQVGAMLTLTNKKQETLLAAGEESIYKCKKIYANTIKCLLRYWQITPISPGARDLHDPSDEQTTCGLILQVFIHHNLLFIFH